MASVAGSFRLPAQTVAVGQTAEAPARITTVTVDIDQVPLDQALRTIAKQAGLRLFFGNAVKERTKQVTMHVRGMSAEDAFARALGGTGLRAEIAAGSVVFSVGANSQDAEGAVTGVVIDAKTKRPVRGANVALDGAKRGQVTDAEGRYRFSKVGTGTHRLTVKMLGYVASTHAVDVQDNETVMADVALETSVRQLDQVVVTGTVVPTELKGVPNAITVITAKELEQRGITHIDQLFRGDVPGLWAQNQGSSGIRPGKVVMESRGSTTVNQYFVRNQFVDKPIKTYVDGVELADPSYLGLIDPRSIERIEIIPGPQASTIYGANAVNGVMQIFTKRGSPRPQITLTLRSGLIQNNYRSAYTSQHDYSAELTETQGIISYNVGGSWTYMGPWTPAVHQATTSGYGGIRIERGILTLNGSLRRTLGTNWENGDPGQSTVDLWERGIIGYFPAILVHDNYTSQGQTQSLQVSLAPTSWWTQTVSLGSDAMDSKFVGGKRYQFGGSDTLKQYAQNLTNLSNVAYTTTVQGALTPALRSVVTAGADGWHSTSSGLQYAGTTFVGFGLSSNFSRQLTHSRGAFLQGQIGAFDQIFFTYGVRAEWNPNYGNDVNPNLTPRYGIAVTREMGAVTAKIRASYGTATQTPGAGQTQGQTVCQWDITVCEFYKHGFGYDIPIKLANLNLLPSHQRGGEGGFDAYLGTQGSLSVTWYNQTVNNIIFSVGVDSVETIIPARDLFGGYDPHNCYPCGYWHVINQNLNVADIRNSGMSMQGSWNLGSFTATGTYSWNRSRVLGVTPKYQRLFPNIVRGASFLGSPEHTFAGSLQYAHARTSVAINWQGQGSIYKYGDPKGILGCSGSKRLTLACPTFGGNLKLPTPGYALADLNVTHRVSAHAEGIVQVQNLTNSYRFDEGSSSTVIGRQSKAGLRIRW